MTKRTALLLAGLLLLPAAANAQDLLIRRSCTGHHTRFCVTTIVRPSDTGIAKIVAVPVDPDAPVPTPEWSYAFERICRPEIVVDRHGVSRYVYAHEGCDVGILPNGDNTR